MTRRAVLFGLVRLPLDPLLLLLIAGVTFAELRAELQGDVVRTVDGVVFRAHEGSFLGQATDRVLVAVLVALVLWVVPAFARRSRQQHLGEPSQPGRFLLRPWHRDWLVWFAFAMSVLAAGSHRRPDSTVVAGVRHVTGTWLPVLGTAIFEAAFLCLIILGVVGGLRGLYRALGEPARPAPD